MCVSSRFADALAEVTVKLEKLSLFVSVLSPTDNTHFKLCSTSGAEIEYFISFNESKFSCEAIEKLMK